MPEYDSSLRAGLMINLNDGDGFVRVIQTSGNDDVFRSRQGMTIGSPATSRVRDATAGVRGMRLRAPTAVVSSDVAVTTACSVRLVERPREAHPDRIFGRDECQGVRGMRVTEARGVVVAAFIVSPGDGSSCFAGNLSARSRQGRDATGVRVARVGEGDTVVAVARVLEAEHGDGENGDGENGDAEVGEES